MYLPKGGATQLFISNCTHHIFLPVHRPQPPRTLLQPPLNRPFASLLPFTQLGGGALQEFLHYYSATLEDMADFAWAQQLWLVATAKSQIF